MKWLIAKIINPSNTNAKLDEFNDKEKVEAIMYKQIMSSFRYLCNRIPNIYCALMITRRLMIEPRKSHLVATKRILMYPKETMKFDLLFSAVVKEKNVCLIGYSNFDCCGYKIDRRSISRYVRKYNVVCIF